VTIKHREVVEKWIDAGCFGDCNSGKSMSTHLGAVYSYSTVIGQQAQIMKDGLWEPVVFVLRQGPTMSTNRHINLLKDCLTEKGVTWFENSGPMICNAIGTVQEYEGNAWLEYSKALKARSKGKEYIQEALHNIRKAEELNMIYGVELSTVDSLKALIEEREEQSCSD
jgi:hypothetical protein